MSRESLQRFSEFVRGNDSLERELQLCPNQQAFVSLSVQRGEENGFKFTEKEMNEWLQEINQQVELSYPIVQMEVSTANFFF